MQLDHFQKENCVNLLIALGVNDVCKDNIFMRAVVYYITFNLICNMDITILKKLFFNRVRGHSQSDPKMVHDTPQSQDASTNQTKDSYPIQYRKYALDMIIL